MLLRETVIDNWVTALCNIAVEKKKQLAFIEQCNVIVEVLKNREEFAKILNVHIDVLKSQIDKNKILDEVFLNQGFNVYLVNAMKILAREYSFEYARPIFKGVRKKLLLDLDQEYGVIWSTIKLNEADIKVIETKISKKLKIKVKLVNKIDEKLIGGVQVVVAHNVFDLSIKGQLDQLKLEALKNRVE